MSRPVSFPWLTFNRSRQDKVPSALGGVTEVYIAGAALNSGDCVFLSAANTVNKSLTAANYAGFIGVVVGGQLTQDNIVDRVGVPCAGTNQRVIVQIIGNARVVAGGAITAGTNFTVIPDSAGTAGRVVAGTTAGQILGKALTTTTGAGQELTILLSHR